MDKISHEIKDHLRKNGYKATPARQAILKTLSGSKKPLTAMEVFIMTKKSNIDLVTIYRTLASFEKKKIIKKVDLHTDSQHYELAESAGGHHHHLVCTGCGMTEDFRLCDVDDITEKVLKGSKGFEQIDQHSLELFGLCRSCVRG